MEKNKKKYFWILLNWLNNVNYVVTRVYFHCCTVLLLNKNVNCYNIEKNFKCNTVISTFCDHITIFRTRSIDIWQLNVNNDKQKKRNNGEFFFANFSKLPNFSCSFLWEKPLWNQKLLILTVKPLPTLSCFPFVHNSFWH